MSERDDLTALSEDERTTMRELRAEIGPPTAGDRQWNPMVSAAEVRTLLDALDRLAGYESPGSHARGVEEGRTQAAGAITWDTTCFNCAHLLDRCYAETVRAEKVEEGAARVRAAVEAVRDRWQAVLTEVLADSPSSIVTDRSVSTLDMCLNELDAALVSDGGALAGVKADTPCSHPGWRHIGSERYCAACGVDRDDVQDAAHDGEGGA